MCNEYIRPTGVTHCLVANVNKDLFTESKDFVESKKKKSHVLDFTHI